MVCQVIKASRSSFTAQRIRPISVSSTHQHPWDSYVLVSHWDGGRSSLNYSINHENPIIMTARGWRGQLSQPSRVAHGVLRGILKSIWWVFLQHLPGAFLLSPSYLSWGWKIITVDVTDGRKIIFSIFVVQPLISRLLEKLSLVMFFLSKIFSFFFSISRTLESTPFIPYKVWLCQVLITN